MKKIFFISALVIILASLVLMGCQSTPTTTAPPAATTTPPAATTTSPAKTTTPVATSPAPTAQAPIELKFSYHAPPTASLATAVFEPWAKELEEATGGRVKITRHPGGTLVSSKDAYDAVATGLCDIAQVDTEENPGRFPISGLNSLPFFYPSTSVAGPVTHELLNKYAVNSELKEVKLLLTAPLHPSQYFGNKKVNTIQDFSGLKMRASGKIESATVDALKGVPVDITTVDLNSSLDRGTVDGCFFTYSGALAFGIKDIVKYCTEADVQIRVHTIAMNKNSYEKLPADIKAIFDKYSLPETSLRFAKAHEAAQIGPKKAIAGALAGAGKDPIYALTAEERAKWKEAAEQTWRDWAADLNAKGLKGDEILAEAQQLMEQYSK